MRAPSQQEHKCKGKSRLSQHFILLKCKPSSRVSSQLLRVNSTLRCSAASTTLRLHKHTGCGEKVAGRCQGIRKRASSDAQTRLHGLSLSLNNLLTSEWENTQRRREVNGIKDVILPGRHLGGSITHAPPADKEKREQQCGAAKINTE